MAKKQILLCVLFLLFGSIAPAAQAASSNWGILSAGFWFGAPESSYYQTIYGAKFGLPISSGVAPVYGCELSLFSSSTDYVSGLQGAIVLDQVQDIYGLQLACVNICSNKCNALQLGVVNSATNSGVQFGVVNLGDRTPFQIGLININRYGILPVMILVNWTAQ